MAEAIALCASVVAVLQLADRIIALCKFYIETTKDTPSDLRAILVETSTIKMILENLQFLIEHDDGLSSTLESLARPDGPVEGCRKAITELESLFPSDCVQVPTASKKRKIKATLTALAWPLKEQKPRKLLERMVQYKTTISLVLTTDSLHELKDIRTKSKQIHDMLSDSERREVYKWLEDTDPSPIHHRACKQYETGTCNWMLRTPECTAWLDGQRRCVWIHGIPGAGKTILASHLIESIKNNCDKPNTGKFAFAYYYCYFGHNQDETIPFLKWTISRLCRQSKSVSPYLYTLYRNGASPSLEEFLSALEESTKSFDRVYLVLDAIDESLPRDDLLKVLRDLVSEPRFQRIQLLATSREYFDIETVMKQISDPVSMLNPFLEEDIRIYVRSQVRQNQKISRWSAELKEEVVEVLAKKAKGMFRWVVCQIDALQRLKADSNIVKNALARLPKTLYETYERIFLQISDEDRLFVHHALQWIYYHLYLHDDDNISCANLLQAVEKSTSKVDGSTVENFYDIESLRELCGCLIGVAPEKRQHDCCHSQDSIWCVYFAHYTVWEFLTSGWIRNSPAAFFAVIEKTTRIDLTRVVVDEVLQIRQGKSHGSEVTKTAIIDLLENDFETYCIVASILSVHRLGIEVSGHEDLISPVLDLLDPSKPHYDEFTTRADFIIAETEHFELRGLLQHNTFHETIWTQQPRSYIVTLANLLQLDESCELAKIFLKQVDTEELLRTQLSAQMTLACNGEYYTIKGTIIEIFANMSGLLPRACALLIELGGTCFDLRRALLYVASSHDHDSCPRYCPLSRLLEFGVTPNLPGYKVTPLQIAVAVADLCAIKILLDKGANPNGTGDSTGYEWPEKSALGRFNHLYGISPLRICRTKSCLRTPNWDTWLAPEVKKLSEIEATLLEYGAKDFQNI